MTQGNNDKAEMKYEINIFLSSHDIYPHIAQSYYIVLLGAGCEQV